MGSENPHKATSEQIGENLPHPETQGPLDASEPPQLLACLLILLSDAEPIVSLLKNLAASLPCTGFLPVRPDPPKATCDPWLKHAEAAEYLGISKSTLYQYACQQKIECRKMCGRLEYHRSTLDQFRDHQIRQAHRWLSRGSIIPSALGSGK
jgi:excisionase family DNA binding protein